MRKHYKGDDPDAIHEAAQRVDVPLSDFMVRPVSYTHLTLPTIYSV